MILITTIIVGLILIETTFLTMNLLHKRITTNNTDVYVDTSVLIDGRIVDIVSTGFMLGSLVIPRSVIRELQLLADGRDNEKRARARRGLDVIRILQDSSETNVSILADKTDVSEGVDERLLTLVKKNGGKLLTIDYNLNKVAQVEGIAVLNINELAKQLRMSFLPGDTMTIELTSTGSNNGQAVGHLDDGTMVVVDGAKSRVGQKVEIEVIRNLQTSAGRMMFARLRNNQPKHLPRTAKKPTAARHDRIAPGGDHESELVALANRRK